MKYTFLYTTYIRDHRLLFFLTYDSKMVQMQNKTAADVTLETLW